MHCKRVGCVGLALAALGTSQADADVWVHQYRESDGAFSVTRSFSSGAAIPLELPAVASTDVVRIDVTTDLTTDDIGRITFSYSNQTQSAYAGTVRLCLGGEFSSTNDAPTTKAGHDWSGVDPGVNASPAFIRVSKLDLYGYIGGSLVGTVGDASSALPDNAEARIHAVWWFQADGDIKASILANGPGVSRGAVVVATSILAPSSGDARDVKIAIQQGDIDTVKTTGTPTQADPTIGTLRAEVHARDGTIKLVSVTGNLNGPVRAQKGTTASRAAIDKIEVAGAIDAADFDSLYPIRAYDGVGTVVAKSISANFAIVGSVTPDEGGRGPGRIQLFKTTDGNFSGVLNYGYVENVANQESGIIINGDLQGSSSTNQAIIRAMCANTHDSTARIWIKGSVGNYGKILFDDPTGLETQVIVNGADNSGIWSGPVVVGNTDSESGITGACSSAATSLGSNPYYAQSSTTLGGGAVGLVPYRLHAADCVPAHYDDWGSDTPPGTPLLNSLFSQQQQSVRMRFYGPVYTEAPGGANGEGVAVWYWLTRSLRWQDVTDAAAVTIPRSADAAWSREIVVTGNNSPLPPGFYAVVARTDGEDPWRLVCNGTTASTAPSPEPNMGANVEYNFRLWADCDNNWQIDALGARTYCHDADCSADVDDASGLGIPDGGVDVNDLLYYLAIYEAGAPGADVDDGSSTGTPDGGVDINDLLYFLDRYEAGC